jgi:tRNA-2-methylthio-N6-dimethylallyladenosine synthase
VGKTLRGLVDGRDAQREGGLTARTEGGRLVHLDGDEALIGTWQQVNILRASTWVLFGELL